MVARCRTGARSGVGYPARRGTGLGKESTPVVVPERKEAGGTDSWSATRRRENMIERSDRKT